MGALDSLIAFLQLHQNLTYGILFAGSYFDTFIGVSFLVPGEIFFLAGSILAGLGTLNLLSVMAVLYVGGILGDHSSYLVGRLWGERFYLFLQGKPFFKKFFTTANYDRGSAFFSRFGGWSVFIARFLGPVSWITPFLAGVFKMKYFKFTLFEIPAVVLGIGQFILVGYLFGKNYHATLAVAQQYFLITIFVLACVVILFYYYRKLLRKVNFSMRQSLLHFFTQLRSGNRKFIKKIISKICITFLIFVVLYLSAVAAIFFIGGVRLSGVIEPDINHSFTSYDELTKSIDSTTSYKEGTADVGPINLLIVSNEPLDEIMRHSLWLRDKTFVRDKVTLINYFEQMKDNVYPISDLYFKNVPQNYAYQFASSTFRVRQHVRVWNYGTYQSIPVYALSVSKDVGFDFYRNLSFIIPLHAVDPNVDSSRDLLVGNITKAYPTATLESTSSSLGRRGHHSGEDSLYYTDGNILILKI